MFVDLHTHILAGVDDGPEHEEQMYGLLQALYADGVAKICCTPHYHPGYYGRNQEEVSRRFSRLEAYIREKKLDMRIYPGNELHYSQRCFAWMEEGLCRTLNGTRYVLVDFDREEEYRTMESAVRTFLNEGYIPVLAHVERYPCLGRKTDLVKKLRGMGAVIQVNASSILRKRRYPLVKRLLREKAVDVVASDTHNLETRPPLMGAAYQEISRRYGKEYADSLFAANPSKILENVQQEEWKSE